MTPTFSEFGISIISLGEYLSAHNGKGSYGYFHFSVFVLKLNIFMCLFLN